MTPFSRKNLIDDASLLNTKVSNLQFEAEENSRLHSEKVMEITPLLIRYQTDAKKLQTVLDGLLLDVNLTTGLFKKREHEVQAVHVKLNENNSERKAIENERSRCQIDYAIMKVDARRNGKIFDVVMAANNRATEEGKRDRERYNEMEEALLVTSKNLKLLAKEELNLKIRLADEEGNVKKLEQEMEKDTREVSRLTAVYNNISEQVDELLGKFDDEKLDNMRDLLDKVKAEEGKNKNLEKEIDRIKGKIAKVENNIGHQGILESTLHEFH